MSSTKVNFLSNGIKVVGDLYAPVPGSGNRRGAAVIVGHPYTGVKEQTATVYARYLSSQGFYALAFDAAYQGESEGEPRGLENPWQRVEDFKAAVSYLTTITDKVDPQRIGALGICASGGYVSFAAQADIRIKAVVALVPFCVGRATRNSGPNREDKFNPEVVTSILGLSADSRNATAAGKVVNPIPLAPNSVDEIPPDLGSFMREGTYYYKTKRGFHERSTGLVHPTSLDLMVNYDSFTFNNLISPRPLLIIGGEKAETLHFAEEAYSQANDPKELYVVKGKSHFDVYDDTSATGPKMVETFVKYLCG